MPSSELPSNPRELILVAVDLLTQYEKEGYKVKFGSPYSNTAWLTDTQMCLAGAVMLRLFDKKYQSPAEIEDLQIRRKLYALDLFSMGRIEKGLEQLGLARKDNVPVYFTILSWKEDLLKLAEVLK